MDKIRKVASKVRAVVEKKVKEVSEKENVSFTDLGEPDNLEGACGYASWGLWKAVPGSTLVVGAWDGLTHCWVEYNGHIVDVTATQFGFERKVRIISKRLRGAKLYREECRNCTAERELVSWYPKEWQTELSLLLRKKKLIGRRVRPRETNIRCVDG